VGQRPASAQGIPFSVPEIQDLLRVGVKTLSSFGEFSTVGVQTMIGLGRAPGSSRRRRVFDGSYFEVVGLHPVLGRLIGPQR